MERVLSFEGGRTEAGDIRPSIHICLELDDGWSQERFMEAVRTGAFEDIEREKTRALGLRAMRVACDVDGWQIGREIQRNLGIWKPTPRRHVWRRVGETRWRTAEDAEDQPTRAQVRRATIEPHLELVGDLLEDVLGALPDMTAEFEQRSRLVHPSIPEWAAQMSSWELGRIRSARGSLRIFNPAQDTNDDEISNRSCVELDTVRKRRWRDRQLAFTPPPWLP